MPRHKISRLDYLIMQKRVAGLTREQQEELTLLESEQQLEEWQQEEQRREEWLKAEKQRKEWRLLA